MKNLRNLIVSFFHIKIKNNVWKTNWIYFINLLIINHLSYALLKIHLNSFLMFTHQWQYCFGKISMNSIETVCNVTRELKLPVYFFPFLVDTPLKLFISSCLPPKTNFSKLYLSSYFLKCLFRTLFCY